MPKVHLQLHHLLLPAYTLHCIVLVSIDIGTYCTCSSLLTYCTASCWFP